MPRTQKKFETFSEETKQHIVNVYKKHFSVSEVMKNIPYEGRLGRGPVVDYLKHIGLYEGLGPNNTRLRIQKVHNTLDSRYGVTNPSQLDDAAGLRERNNRPYDRVKYLGTDLVEYKRAVERATKTSIRKEYGPRFNKKWPPAYCEYTGIMFADKEGSPNPNDPRKRTVDHIIPVVICYINGSTVQAAASLDNVAFVLRCVNSLKANTAYKDFIPIAHKLRKVLIDEGFQSNPAFK